MAGPGLEITVVSTIVCGASPIGRVCRMRDNKLVFRQCGTGWDAIIIPLIEEADKGLATVMQIKEKFGRLRFYCHNASDKLDDMIEAAEVESGKTCEMCGKPGVLMKSGGWFKTLCADDALQLGFKKRA